jgi:ribosomal protein S18 acetylase RimI-like enzyme
MINRQLAIVPMKRTHISACQKIVRSSEPWRTLKESIDFPLFIAAKQAIVCLSEDKILGFAIYSPRPVFARGGYLRAIAVDPSSRGQGVGTFVLTYIERETLKHADNLYLCVSSFNRVAKRFYANAGYIKIGAIPGLIRNDINEIILWKKIVRTSKPRKVNR